MFLGMYFILVLISLSPVFCHLLSDLQLIEISISVELAKCTYALYITRCLFNPCASSTTLQLEAGWLPSVLLHTQH